MHCSAHRKNMVQPAGTQMGKSGTIKCDFVIVGAGSSGCVLASRLVRRGLKVLLIEAGPGDATKYLQSPSKWLHAACSGKALSEAFTTEPQPGLSNRRISAYRGRGGGGSSNINATLYSRGRRVAYVKDDARMVLLVFQHHHETFCRIRL